MHQQKPSSIKVCLDRLRMDVERNPDDYQWERAKRFGVTQPAIHDALKRLNLRYKKTLKHPKACEISRNSFVERINEFEKQGKEFVYLDESDFAQSMPRECGYSDKGTRCYRIHDWHAEG